MGTKHKYTQHLTYVILVSRVPYDLFACKKLMTLKMADNKLTEISEVIITYLLVRIYSDLMDTCINILHTPLSTPCMFYYKSYI